MGRKRERERDSVCMREIEKEGEIKSEIVRVCVFTCEREGDVVVCERERKKEREKKENT